MIYYDLCLVLFRFVHSSIYSTDQSIYEFLQSSHFNFDSILLTCILIMAIYWPKRLVNNKNCRSIRIGEIIVVIFNANRL